MMRDRTFRFLLRLLVPVMGLALLAACSSSPAVTPSQTQTPQATASQPGQPKSGGIIRVGTNSDPATLNPYIFGNEFDRNAFLQIYDQLVAYDLKTYEVKPHLIESWTTSPDGLTWTLKVRQGVKFHDGRPMTAKDVKWSFQQALDPKATRTAPLLSFVKSVDVQDDATVKLTLSQPDQLLPHTMVDIRVTPEGTTEFNKSPIGTGPFKFVKWEPNREIVYEKNKDYWQKGLPYLDGIQLKTIPDGSVQVIQLLSGELDFINQAAFGSIAQLVNGGMVTAVPPDNRPMGFYDIVVNTRSKPFNDPRVRQALSLAVDRQAITRALFGYATVQSNPIPKNSPAFAADALNYDKRDVAKAKQLLADAGYPNGLTFEMFVHRTGMEYDTVSQVIQQTAADAGLKVEIKGVDIGTWVDNVFGKKTFQAGFSAKVPKPVEYDLIAHMFAKTVGDASGWKDQKPEFYDLLTKARSIADKAQYEAALKDLQKMAMEGLNDIPLAGRLVPAAHASYVKGFIHQVQGNMYFTSVWLDK